MVLKKKREILAVLLALVFMFVSVACGGGNGGGGNGDSGNDDVGNGGDVSADVTQTAYSVYNQAYEALSKIDSFAANTTMIMTTLTAGGEMPVAMTGFIKMVNLSETEVEMQMDMQTDYMGFVMDSRTFYKDGMYYIDIAGAKNKVEVPLDQIMKQVSSTEAFIFSEDAIKNQNIVDKNGGKELSFTLDGNAVINEIFAQIGDFADMMAADGIDMSIGDVDFVVFIDGQNNLKTTWMSLNMDMSIMGDTASVNLETRLEYLQINNVTIDFPDDLDAYELADYSNFF